MIFGVPQYIDVEDKIAGPLTARQFLWMLGYGGILIVMWSIFEIVAFFVMAIPFGMFFAALAFYRPHGVHLITFVGYALTYLFHPKVYVWKRLTEKKKSKESEDQLFQSQFYKAASRMDQRDISALAETLDTEGEHRSDRFMEIIAAQQKKNSKK